MNKRILNFLSIAILLLGLVLNSCNREPEILKIGYLPIAAGLPIYIAHDEGYFEEQGIDQVELIRFASSNEVGNALAANKIDVGFAASNVIFDVGFISKKKHKLILPNPYSNKAGFVTDYLIVGDTSQIKELSDLKNKRIGIFPGSVVKVFCELILAKSNLTPDDYELVELLPKDWTAALSSGQIDALSAVEPIASQIMKDDIGVSISDGFYSILVEDVPLSAHWVNSEYVEKNGVEKTMRIVRAYDKAVDLISNDPSKAKVYLVKYANLRKDIQDRVSLNPWVTHDKINPQEFQSFIDILAETGAIQNREMIEDYLIPKN